VRRSIPSKTLAALLMAWVTLLLPGASMGLGGAPEVEVLIERMALALGGARGGARVLEKARVVDFTYTRSIKESSSGRKLSAVHRYLQVVEGDRTRLDIRISSGKGKDSATIVQGGKAWLIVDDATHEVALGAVEARLGEFSPARLFSVPLALAVDGPQMLGDAGLTLAGKVDAGTGARFILVGTGSDGREAARLEVDARSYRPAEVAFRSAGGDIVYRYGDYREVSPGLIIPFRREFLRNGILLSSTEVLRFKINGKVEAAAFDTKQQKLGRLPGAP